MKNLKLQYPQGSDVALVEIKGNPKNPEPGAVRIAFPGGSVEVVRATEGEGADYWVHVYVNRPEAGHFVRGEDQTALILDARLDAHGGTAAFDRDLGDFRNPHLYHVALRVHRTPADDVIDAWKAERVPAIPDQGALFAEGQP